MARYWRLFWHYLLQYAKVRLAYKTDFIVSVIATLVATAFGLLLVYLFFSKAPVIAGWTYDEILFLYGFGLIPLALFNAVSVNLYYFGQLYIVEGKFDRVLLRPVHSLFQVMTEQFRLESLSDAVVGAAIVAYAAARLGLEIDWLGTALVLIAALAGLVVYLGVFLALTCIGFWVEDRVGVIPPVYNMLAFGRYPLDIYNPLIKFLLSWIVPFAFAGFYPAANLLGRERYEVYMFLLPVVAVVTLTFSVWLWNKGVRNYSSTGS